MHKFCYIVLLLFITIQSREFFLLVLKCRSHNESTVHDWFIPYSDAFTKINSQEVLNEF